MLGNMGINLWNCSRKIIKCTGMLPPGLTRRKRGRLMRNCWKWKRKQVMYPRGSSSRKYRFCLPNGTGTETQKNMLHRTHKMPNLAAYVATRFNKNRTSHYHASIPIMALASRNG